MSTAKEFFNEVLQYVSEQGGRFEEWYVGIAADPEKRLFVEHGVNRDFGAWIYSPQFDSDTVRVIEQILLEQYGFKGGPGGGDDGTKYAYAYKITSFTKE